jgi:hypothetical protein
MFSQLVEIANVANMIPLARLVDVYPSHRSVGQFFDSLERFKNRAGITASATDVIYFRTTRCGKEPLCKRGDIEGMDIIPNLFSLVSVNIVVAFR